MSQLLITGNATAGAYQQALRYVKYTVGDQSQHMGRRRSHPHYVLEAVRHGGHNLDLLSLGAGSELVHEDRLADQVLEERHFPGLWGEGSAPLSASQHLSVCFWKTRGRGVEV